MAGQPPDPARLVLDLALSSKIMRHKIDRDLAPHHLMVVGMVPSGATQIEKSLALVGPASGFWNHFIQSREFNDGKPDPLDRWSRRILKQIASHQGATAFFPFGGKPYHPFYSWALASQEAWASPVGFLVHARQGLFISYRGALAFEDPFPPERPQQSPCPTCSKPCLTACPVSALTADGYDVDTCKTYLDSDAGQDCRKQGCHVRRACPVGQTLRKPSQSAFHMAAFHPEGHE